MFTFRRSSFRLATSRPFSHPPRTSAGYAIRAPLPDIPNHDPPNPNPTPNLNNLLDTLQSSAQTSANTTLPPFSQSNPFPTSQFESHVPPVYRLHCHSTKINTINTFTDPNGNVVSWLSGGSCGFKKKNRGSYEAGYQCAVRMFAVIQEKLEEEKGKLKAANPWTSVVDDPKNPPFRVDMFFKGFGTGREALYRAMLTAQGDVVRPIVSSITDRTAIKIGGTRAKKRKRQ